MDCIFCKIVSGEMNADIVYHDDSLIAFNDIDPKAPHHILIIPRKHIATLNEITQNDENLIGHIVLTAKKLAEKLEIAEKGYRLLVNCNKEGGQTVYHLHFHLLGGRTMKWPPG
jgi:histidine triad (HIT) family protein